MIKKLLAMLTAGILCMSLAACGGDDSSTTSGNNNVSAVTQQLQESRLNETFLKLQQILTHLFRL